MVSKQMEKIFDKVQTSTVSHQKQVIILTDLYKKTASGVFLKHFLECLYVTLSQSLDNELYSKRVLTFASRFCAEITKKEENDDESHDFLATVLEYTLQWMSAQSYDLRYHCCFFINKVMQDIGDVQLEVALIDSIQGALIDRTQETKVSIRLLAMSALVRLQDPQNFECPVIQSYIQALVSVSAQIRKEALLRIAPNVLTLSKIKERVADCDPGVRMVVFQRCADIGPMNFRIGERHEILNCGFRETVERVKNTFVEYLLPKWLTAYKGNYLKFLGGLKLIADEEDMIKMESLSRLLIGEFFKSQPFDEMIGILPLTDEKFIEIDDLNNDVTLYWNILSSLFRQSDEMDEYLGQVLPELPPFCEFLDRVIKIKSKEKMDEWKFLEYQFDLLNLLKILENYDFSDEACRRTMRALALQILQNNNFTLKLTKKLVSIVFKCSSNVEFFTNDMCNLISDIREPLMEEPLTEDEVRERNYEAARLRVKINILRDQQEEAVKNADYQKAQDLETQCLDVNKQLEALQSQSDVEKVRVAKSDNETLCRCLDILSSILELPEVSKLTPSLTTYRDEFLIPLITHQAIEIHWRVLKCLALYAEVDRATAEEYAKVICIPIATYRTVPINNVSALIQSICGTADLIRLYGVDIVSPVEEAPAEQSKRRLYNHDNEEDGNGAQAELTISYIFETLLDMLDDERVEVRDKAVLAVSVLARHSFKITPTLLSRILLKWYSPNTEKHDTKLQITLGFFIESYFRFKNSAEVLKDAIVPTLSSIVRAPRASPLADIDVDNVLVFFSEMMNVHLEKDELRILALDLCMKIYDSPEDRIVPCLLKILHNLDLGFTDVTLGTELVERAEMLLENIPDKVSRKHIEKLTQKWRLQNTQVSRDQREETMETTETEASGSTQTDDADNLMKAPQQVKRRKNRTSRECVVRLEKLNVSEMNRSERNNGTGSECIVRLSELSLSEKNSDKRNETTLHTIVEDSMEMVIDDDLSNESVASKNSKESGRSRIVVSETSDSDLGNDSETVQRRSMRCRKKRILT